MKGNLFLLTLILFTFSAISQSNLESKIDNLRPSDKSMSERDWGVGVRLGLPTGVSIKKYFGDNALDFTIGSYYRSQILLRGALLFSKEFADVPSLFWYYGAGASFDIGRNDFDFLVDGYVGVEYRFLEVPFSTFVDIGPSIEIVDDPLSIWIHGSMGIRYDF